MWLRFTVTGISPTAGPTAGSTTVTITGTGFTGAAAVKFGTTNATSYTVNSSTQITATAPSGSAGTVDIKVTTVGGTSTTSGSDQYTYAAAPTITTLSPTAGPTAGGTSVTITGTNFIDVTTVEFGSTNATSYTVNSSTQITATSPAGSSRLCGYHGDCQAALLRKQLLVLLCGCADGNRHQPHNGSDCWQHDRYYHRYEFHGRHGSGLWCVSGDQLHRELRNANYSGRASGFSRCRGYHGDHGWRHFGNFRQRPVHLCSSAPTVTGISPTAGPTAGGTSITITGTNLTSATAVKFGSTNATSYTVNSSTQITATAPSGSAGTVNVTVISAGGTSATSGSDQFTYVSAPSVSSISPTGGPTAGGTSVTISGSNFTSATAVNFGGTAATSYTVNSSSQITATALHRGQRVPCMSR